VSTADAIICSPFVAQRRVTGTCAGGSSIRIVAQSGTVSCELDDVGAPYPQKKMWSGYCASHSIGSGWATYCHNAVERDSMGSTYMTRESEC